MKKNYQHIPVLSEEVCELLALKPGQTVLDCTVGLGGHAQKILKKILPGGRLIALDQDEEALKIAKQNLKSYKKDITYIHANFKDIYKTCHDKGIFQVDAVLADLGLSSLQIDKPERGFSYIQEGPLDMRMDCNLKKSALDIVNNASATELQQIFMQYGEERFYRSKKVAEAICQTRAKQSITTTKELGKIIEQTVSFSSGKHPSLLFFQALRIAVNEELDALKSMLPQAIKLLVSNGRLAVISFHSLEDRVVKQFIKLASQNCICPPESPICTCDKKQTVERITTKVVKALPAEIQINPRARSAKLRVCRKI